MADEAFYNEAIDSLVNHDKDAAEDVAKRAIAAGVSPQDIMQNGLRRRHPQGRRPVRRGRGLPARAHAGRRGDGSRDGDLQRGTARGRERDARRRRHGHRRRRRPRHRQGHRVRVSAGERLRRPRPRSRRARGCVRRQGRGGQRRRHRRQRPAHGDDAQAGRDHRRARRPRHPRQGTSSWSAARRVRRSTRTRSAPTPMRPTPATASRRSRSCWASSKKRSGCGKRLVSRQGRRSRRETPPLPPTNRPLAQRASGRFALGRASRSAERH